MPRRALTFAIAVAIVVARLVGGGGVARAAATEPSVRGALVRVTCSARPQRAAAAAARALRVTADDVGVVGPAPRVDEPVRSLAPESVVARPPAVVAAPAPATSARAPPV